MILVKPSFEILDNIDGADILKKIERAGRTCYKSESKITEDSAQEFVRKILKRGHECYDDKTEVLSERGWLHWDAVTFSDRLATIRLEDNIIEYHKPINIVKTRYKGRMYKVDCRGVNLLVTPNHKMVVCLMTTIEGRKKEKYSLISVESLDLKNHSYLKVGNFVKGKKLYPYSILKLLGFSIGDGFLSKSKKQIKFHLKKHRKIKWLCGLGVDILIQKSDQYVYNIPEKYRQLFSDIYDTNKEKQIPQYILQHCCKKSLKALFAGLIESDGNLSNGCLSYASTSIRLLGQIQQLCLQIGSSANIGKFIGNTASKNSKDMQTLFISIRGSCPEVNRTEVYKAKSYWIDDWEGFVYCAEVPNNTLYVRRDGIPVWSGNSVIEHEKITFKIICDRGILQEIVRHRIASYSVESSRFCDYTSDHITFIIPNWTDLKVGIYKDILDIPVNAQNPGYHFLNCLLDIERLYKYLRDKGWKPEQARSVLPNSLKTEIVVTMNLRELRHFFSLRCAKAAHPQMREITLLMLKEFHRLIPVIFDDLYEKFIEEK